MNPFEHGKSFQNDTTFFCTQNTDNPIFFTLSQVELTWITFAISMTTTDDYAVLAQARDARPPWPPKKWLPQPSSPRKIFTSASPPPAMKKR